MYVVPAMAGGVAPWPQHPPPGDGELPPSDIYKLAVEEYRFQAQYNWSRTQYLLAFNAGIITAATVLAASRPGRYSIFLFALGFAAAVMSVFVVRTQHDYYRAARNRMRRLEEQFSVPLTARVDTTSTLGDRRRTVSVNQVVYLLLASIATTNLVAMTIIAMR